MGVFKTMLMEVVDLAQPNFADDTLDQIYSKILQSQELFNKLEPFLNKDRLWAVNQSINFLKEMWTRDDSGWRYSSLFKYNRDIQPILDHILKGD